MSSTTLSGWSPGFGRNVEHPESNWLYLVPRLGEPGQVEALHDVTWPHHGPVLDQDGVGACTAFTFGDLEHAQPLYSRQQATTIDRPWCFTFYALATSLDPFPGQWYFDRIEADGTVVGHGDDTGSSSLGMYRAAKQLGLIDRVEWAMGIQHAQEALQRGPVAFGIPWKTGMMQPDSDGRIHYTGDVEGGHEVAAFRLRLDTEDIWIFNHWLKPDRTPWGVNGWARMHIDEWGQALEEQGDCAQFLRNKPGH